MKQKIRLSESSLRKMIKESVKQVLKESMSSNDYINRDLLYQETVKILEDEISNYEDNSYDVVDADYYIEEYAQEYCNSVVRDMKKYIESGEYHMRGNFANIKRDYEHSHSEISFKEVIQMIQNGENNTLTNEFRDWCVSWFWDAFGTFGLTYKFGVYYDAVLDSWEYDEEEGN